MTFDDWFTTDPAERSSISRLEAEQEAEEEAAAIYDSALDWESLMHSLGLEPEETPEQTYERARAHCRHVRGLP